MAKKKITPRLMTVAYLVWCWCKERDWDCTPVEAARGAGVRIQELNAVLRFRHPSWRTLFRVGGADSPEACQQPKDASKTVQMMGYLPQAEDLDAAPY